MSDSLSRLSPDQIRFLSAPIWGPALRQDPKAAKGNVYIPGNFVLAQLNAAFCYDGWSFEVVRVERVHMEKYQKDGKDQYRALFMVEGKLTVRCQDGSTFVRSGIGADEKTSNNMKDVISLATKSAYTDAIKNAAITLGRQFGLDTVRAGKDAEGQAINWKRNASGDRPHPPMFAGLSAQIDGELEDEDGEMIEEDGVRYNSRTGVVDESRPQQTSTPSQSSSTTSTPQQERAPQQEQQRREPAPQNNQQGPSQSSSTSSQTSGGNGQVGSSGGNGQVGSSGGNGQVGSSGGNGNGQQQSTQASQGGNGGGGQGGGVDRTALVNQCREAFRTVGAAAAGNVFSQVAQRHGYQGSMPMIGRPQENGGPPAAFLHDYLDALQKAVR